MKKILVAMKKAQGCRLAVIACMVAVSARAITINEFDSLSVLIDSLEEVRESMVFSQQSLGLRIFGEVRPYLMYHYGGSATKFAHFVGDSFPTMWANEFGAGNDQNPGQFAYVTNQGPGRLDFCREANEPFLRLRIHARPLRDLQLRLSLTLTNRLLGGETFASRNGHWFFSFALLQLFEELAAEIKFDLPALGAFRTTLGGVLWQDYSPFTLWDKKVKFFPFFKSPWEGNYGQLDIYRSNMLKGEDYGPFTWVKRGIKGIMFKSLEMPADLEFTGHFGIINSAWSEKYVKNRVFSTEEAPFADVPYVQRNLLDTIAANERFNDDWSAAARLAWKGNEFTQPLAFTWFNGFNTNKTSDYLFTDKNPYYHHSYGAGLNRGAREIKLAPDYVWNVFALEDKADFGGLALSGEASLSGVNFPGKAGRADGTFAVDTTILGFGGFLLAETKMPVAANSFRMRSRIGCVQPSFYTNSKDNASIPGFLITPATYRYSYAYLRSYNIDNISVYFRKDPEAIVSPQGDTVAKPVNNLAEPDIHTIIPTIGDERLMVNALSTSIKFLLPVPTGHAFLSLAVFHELKPSNNLVEFPYTLNGKNLYFALQNSPYTIGHYYNDYALGYFGRGDTSAIAPARFQVRNPINRSNPIFGTQSAGLLTDYHCGYERFRYFRKDGVDTIRFQVGRYDCGSADTLEGTPSKKQIRKLGIDFGFDLADYFSALSRTTLVECVLEARSVFEANSAGGKYGVVPNFNDDNILNGQFASLSIVQEITPIFCIVGMAGTELWQSRHAWVWDRDADFNYWWARTPIDYVDYLFGIGFDWNLTSRTGLHVRVQKYGHIDRELVDINGTEINTYNNLQLVFEMKTFF